MVPFSSEIFMIAKPVIHKHCLKVVLMYHFSELFQNHYVTFWETIPPYYLQLII